MPQDQSPGELRAAGKYGEALRRILEVEAARALHTRESVLKAELLSLTGDVDAALYVAQDLLRQKDLTTKQRCIIRGVCGRSYFRKGVNDKAREHYREGINLAQKANDTLEESRLRVQLFQHEVHWIGPYQPTADLATLRRKVHQVGDSAIATSLHLALTELAAKLGLLPRAMMHLDAARSLLQLVPDVGCHADFRVTEVALYLLDANFSQALRSALELVKLVQVTESASARFALATNLGHLQLMQARFEEAEASLEQVLAERKFVGSGDIPIRDTLMMLRLAQGNLDGAQGLSESIDTLLEGRDAQDSYFGYWHLLTRVRWLYQANRVNEGLLAAKGAIPKLKRLADINLLARMTLLAAEGCERSGELIEGARYLETAAEYIAHLPLDVTAEWLRVSARLTATESVELALMRFRQAARISSATGNLAAEAEILRDEGQTLSRSESVHELNRPDELAKFTERIGVLLELASNPNLLGLEVLAIIKATECAASVELIERTAEGVERTVGSHTTSGSSLPPGSDFAMPLGKYGEIEYEIRGRQSVSASARTTLLSVRRIAEISVMRARSKHAQREQAALWPEQSPEQQLGLVCSSERMLDLIKNIRRVASSNITVLLTGETGVGKELFARALHQASPRKDHPFLPFNCTTVSREIIDSQLFGHRRGSFTGAHEDSPGLIRAAAGGTLFLDEIGEMSLESQPKLLRFLESGEVLPLGHHKTELVDVRVVAATNANLEQLVADGKFREDLYYRLNVVRITIPPLRERREEIPMLVDYFLDRFSREQQKPMPRVADETLEYLVLFRWPGNVRQLANEIRRMVALTEPGAVLMPAHLSAEIAASRRTIPAGRPVAAATEVLARIDQPLAAAVEHVERAAIQRALSVCDGRVDDAAKLLGVSRKGLYLKRQRLKIEDADLRRS